jgi:hypothetical protein
MRNKQKCKYLLTGTSGCLRSCAEQIFTRTTATDVRSKILRMHFVIAAVLLTPVLVLTATQRESATTTAHSLRLRWLHAAPGALQRTFFYSDGG